MDAERAGFNLYYECDERARELGHYIINNNATVRQAAAVFKISKSTVHKDDGVIIGTVKGNAKKH